MDKPVATKNRLKIHYCPIHQIDIPHAQIVSSNSTISSKVLSERVLLSINSIRDMSCFLRAASVLLAKEQSGTAHMANRYTLTSILTIYINHSTRTEEADTIRMVYSMVAPEYTYDHELPEPNSNYASTSLGGKARFCIMG